MKFFKIFLCSFALAFGTCAAGVNHQVTVFVHGTCQAGLGILNFRRIWHDLFDGSSWYERSLSRSRNDQFLEKSDLMLGMGLVNVTDLIQLPAQDPEIRHKAAIHSIRAYDAINQAVRPSSDERHYYTFGWSGIMSESGRERAAEHLYDALKTIQQNFTDHGDTVTFTIHAHSHGGQLVLHLAQIRKERGDTDLSIDYALLSATPMYYHKARHAISGMFKTIINFYSEGDMIQTGDCFSTPEHGCCRTFAGTGMPLPSGNTPSPNIIDLRMTACGRPDIFGHACFFILDRYQVFNHLPRKQRKAIRALLKQVHPLPLVALYPALLPAIETAISATGHSGYHNFDANFVGNEQQKLTCEITGPATATIAHIPHAILHAACTEVKSSYADTRYQTEVNKALHSIQHMFGHGNKKRVSNQE